MSDANFDNAREAFDVIAVSKAIPARAETDEFGRVGFQFERTGVVRFSPKGSTAICRVTISTATGGLKRRRLEVDTVGATLLVGFMKALASVRAMDQADGFERDDVDGRLVEAILNWGFDQRGQLIAIGAALEDLGGLDREDEAAVSTDDPLDPRSLARLTSFAEVNDLSPDDRGRAGVEVIFPTGIRLEIRRDPGVQVELTPWDGDDQIREPVPLLASEALLLLTVYCAFATLAKVPWNPHAELRRKLFTLVAVLFVNEFADDRDATELYKELIDLVDPEGWFGAGPAMPLAQLDAIALAAIRCLPARDESGRSAQEIDLGEVATAYGAEATFDDGEWVLAFPSAELVLRVVGTLIVGYVTIATVATEYVSDPVYLSADKFTWVMWLLHCIEELAELGGTPLVAALLEALAEPSYDVGESDGWVRRELDLLSDPRLEDEDLERRVISLLERHP